MLIDIFFRWWSHKLKLTRHKKEQRRDIMKTTAVTTPLKTKECQKLSDELFDVALKILKRSRTRFCLLRVDYSFFISASDIIKLFADTTQIMISINLLGFLYSVTN